MVNTGFKEKMIKFSFLLPTRGRPDLVNRLFQSILDTTRCIEDVEIILCIDDDDLASQKISDDKLLIKKVILPRGATMGVLNRACFEVSSGRYVMFLNDDVILRTKNWDKIIDGIFSAYQDDIALIHVNDLLFREKLCTFPMVSRRACLGIGVCPHEYRRYRIDDHIYDTYGILAYLGHKRIVYLSNVVFEHDNYTRDYKKGHTGQIFKSEDNKVYVPDQEIIEADASIFDEKLEERKQNALKLASLIDQSRYVREQSRYKGLLDNIRDSFRYRRDDFVKRDPLTVEVLKKPVAITVAIVTSDMRKGHARKCLSALKKHTLNFDLIVLDNNNSKDFNHPREMNKVLRMVNTEFLVLMDDDVYVEAGWLDGLLRSLDDDTGVVTPIFKDKSGAISYSGVYLMWGGLGTHAHLLDTPDEPRATQCLCSAIVLIDMKKCGNIFFNTAYKKYFLDLDYSLMVWEAGYKVICTPYTTVTHIGGATMHYITEESSSLWKRDAAIFKEIWIDSGRLAKIEKDKWSQFPFLKSLTDIPKKIELLFENADGWEFSQFKREVEDLFDKIKLLKLFHAQIAISLHQNRLLCNSRVDYFRARFCEEAFKIEYIDSSVLSQVSQFYIQHEKFKEFIRVLKRILHSTEFKDKNKITLIHYTLASIYEKEGSLDKSKESFEKVIELSKEISSLISRNNFAGGAHFHLGCIYQKMGENEKAKQHFEECLRFIPDHGKAWKNLSLIYLQQGKSKEIENKFKEVLSSCKDKDKRCAILIQMSIFYSEQGEYKEAEEKLKEALSLKPLEKKGVYYAIGSIYEEKGALDKAKERFETVIKLFGKEAYPERSDLIGGAHFHLGCIYQKMGDEEIAKQHFKECLRFIPDHKKAKENLERISDRELQTAD